MRKLLIVALVVSASCTRPRSSDTRARCFDYPTSIQPVLEQECGECHGAERAEGGFRTDSYSALLTPDEAGAARVVAGDPTSKLLANARGENDHAYTARPDALATLTRWVLNCRLSYLATDLLHPYGWANPADPDFHGTELRASGWDLSGCEDCHGDGDDPGGGRSGHSCVSCHTDGVGACDTCHGDETTTTAPWRDLDGEVDEIHARHIAGGSALDFPVPCDECHVTPRHWRDPGHVLGRDGQPDLDGRADVRFGTLASASVEGREERRSGAPAYDVSTATCANVYCHGGGLADPKTPTWAVLDDGDAADCTLCHDEPPGGATHAPGVTATDCVFCHAQVVDADSNLVSATLHLDARISLGDGSETCAACHGTGVDGAPPPSLDGGTAVTDPGVGAHQAHLGASVFSGPIACGECHRMPSGDSFLAAVGSTGHVDTALPAEVFPEGLAWIATAENAQPVYDPDAGTCANVYCHGGGDLMSQDQAPGIERTPGWTETGTVACGSCHGVPMTVGTGHLPSWTQNDCVLCHATAVDATGAIVFDNDGTTRHMNGRPDFNQ